MSKFIMIWRIFPCCRCIIETAKLTKEETTKGLTVCPYHGEVTIDKIVRYPYNFEEWKAKAVE